MKVKIVQCWDDGVHDDVRLCEILRKYRAKASFNLNPGLISPQRESGWKYKEKEIWRLSLPEIKEIYDGFLD